MKVIPFCELVWPLARCPKPSPALPLLDRMSLYPSSVSLAYLHAACTSDRIPSSTAHPNSLLQYLTATGTHTAAASESWSHSRHPTVCVLVSPSLPQLHCSIILSHFVTFH